MGIKKYDTISMIKWGRLYVCTILFTCLFVSFFSIPTFAQSELWNPPIFQTTACSRPIKITVESIPVSDNVDSAALGKELANRIVIQFKNVEPKLIQLSTNVTDGSTFDKIIQAVSEQFPKAIVIAITSPSIFSHKTSLDRNESFVCALAIGGGNLKFSAVIADKTLDEFDSQQTMADYLAQNLLRTVQDKAVLFFSTLSTEQTLTIIDNFNHKRLNNKDDSSVPTATFISMGDSKAVYFAGRRTSDAVIAVSIAGNIAIDVVSGDDSELSALAEKIENLELSGLGVEGVLASPVHDSDCIKYKSVLQKHVGKLTPIWGLPSNDSGQIVLFSTPM